MVKTPCERLVWNPQLDKFVAIKRREQLRALLSDSKDMSPSHKVASETPALCDRARERLSSQIFANASTCGHIVVSLQRRKEARLRRYYVCRVVIRAFVGYCTEVR